MKKKYESPECVDMSRNFRIVSGCFQGIPYRDKCDIICQKNEKKRRN